MSSDWIVPLAAASRIEQCGGKAVGLQQLIAAGLPVPDGFAVSAEAFRAAVAGSDALRTAMKQQDAAAARAAILALPADERLRSAIAAAWPGAGPVAVRSSAVAEDLAEASFAGQMDTVLGVRDPDEAIQAIHHCWASLFGDRAVAYRARAGIRPDELSTAVVVQHLLAPQFSGVLFTADPRTGRRSVAVVEAVEGLGEALVSGRATPERYVVPRDPISADGGPTWLAPLVRLGVEAERSRGVPLDLEWAVAGGKVWLLQARPITTLPPVPPPVPSRPGWRVLMSFGHLQVNTAPLSPFGASVIGLLPPFARDTPESPTNAFAVIRGRIYAEVTPLLARPKLAARLLAVLSRMSPSVADRLRAALHRPEMKQVRPLPLGALLRFASKIAPRALPRFLRSPSRRLRGYPQLLTRMAEEARVRLRAGTPSERLAAARAEIGTLLLRLGPKVIPAVAGIFSAETKLKELTQRYAPTEQPDALLRGLDGNVVTEMTLALGDLADLARQEPAVMEAVRRGGAAALEAVRVASPFFTAWDAFLKTYGSRAAGEIDLAVPRFRDDPTLPLKTIASSLERPAGAQREQHRAARREADRVREAILAAAPASHRQKLAAEIDQLRAVFALREHHKLAVIELLAEVRAAALDAGRALVKSGDVERPEDVWLLKLPEVEAALRARARDGGAGPSTAASGLRSGRAEATAASRLGIGPAPELPTAASGLRPGHAEALRLQELVAARRAEAARDLRWSPVPVLTSDGEALAPETQVHAPPDTLVGAGASSGIAEGIARVVTDPATATLAKGEILVAQFTDPGWTPLFSHAAGLVMEVGGTMSHGSVVARELGLPAVVAVDGATSKLKSGQRVRVDGDRGWVTVLS